MKIKHLRLKTVDLKDQKFCYVVTHTDPSMWVGDFVTYKFQNLKQAKDKVKEILSDPKYQSHHCSVSLDKVKKIQTNSFVLSGYADTGGE